MRVRWIVLLVAVLATLATVLLRRERAGETRAQPAQERGAEPPSRAEAILEEPAELVDAGTATTGAAGEVREPSQTAPSGPIRGRLLDAESGAALEAVRIVLLSSPDDRVAESLHTERDGTFLTQRTFPAGVLRAWVRDPGGTDPPVRHEAPFDPREGEWHIPVRRAPAAPTVAIAPVRESNVTVEGRVVTWDGQGVEGAQVSFLPLDRVASPLHVMTESGGHFRHAADESASYRLVAKGSFAVSPAVDVVVGPKMERSLELVLPVAASPGPIRGRLLAEPDGREPFGIMLLTDLASGRELAVPSVFEFELFGGSNDGQVEFELLGVPPGQYALSVVAIDGREYEPSSLRVAPPRDGLEFRARPARGPFLVFDVRAAGSGVVLDDALVLGRVHGQWLDFEPDEPALNASFERWIVLAPGYRAARGGPERAIPIGTDEEGRALARIEVELVPGHALPILFKDAQGTRLVAPGLEEVVGDGLAEVWVLADGVLATTSDADGLALVELERAPAQLTYQRPGWRVAGERDVEGIRFVQMIRE